MIQIKGVIVDWAGTIVDYGSCAPAGAFVELFHRHGVDITVAEARAPMGVGKRDHIRAIARGERVAALWTEKHGEACDDDDVDGMYAEFVPIQIAAIAARNGVIPGTREAIAAFRKRGLKVGSTTGYSREMVSGLVQGSELKLDAVVTASDVSEGRPSPWMAIEAARRMNVYPMRGIVKIGDTVADIDEGRNAGMWTIALAATGNELGLDEAAVKALPKDELEHRLAMIRPRLLAAGAHYVVDNILEAVGIIDQIEERMAKGERP